MLFAWAERAQSDAGGSLAQRVAGVSPKEQRDSRLKSSANSSKEQQELA